MHHVDAHTWRDLLTVVQLQRRRQPPADQLARSRCDVCDDTLDPVEAVTIHEWAFHQWSDRA
jgi:hypothetical protein